MLKKFVPLTSNESPSKNPYEVRTFLGDNCNKKQTEWKAEICTTGAQRKCPPNNTLAKIMTIEDEIRRIHDRTERSRFLRPIRAICAQEDDYLTCVLPRRTPFELKQHALMREYYLKTKRDLSYRVHDAHFKRPQIHTIELDSPIAGSEEEEAESEDEDVEEEQEVEKKPIKPEIASPSCSLDAIFFPPERVLELTRPTSGWFHNESEPPLLEDDGINYSVYNPRHLQAQLNAQKLDRYDVVEGKTPLDLWTWNIGKQERPEDLDRQAKEALVCRFDCDQIELKLYKIPNDLEKTFRVEIVFGNEAVRPVVKTKRHQYYYRPPEIATIFVAYVDSFRLNPDFWTAETMDDILKIGDKLLKKSEQLNYKSPDNDYDIIPQITERNAVIGLKIHFTGPIKSEPNIYKALSLYFSKYNAAVLTSETLFLLIWKRCSKSFYIFDPNGRNENCKRDFDYGKCSLISIHHVEHLVHLVMRYSSANLDADFNLYEIFLVNYGKIVNPIPTKPFPKTIQRNWAVVNPQYAVIPAATTGLQQPVSGKEQNSSILVSLIGFLYSDMERAKDWRPETIDDLFKFGAHYYKNLARRIRIRNKEKNKGKDKGKGKGKGKDKDKDKDKDVSVNVLDLPTHITMGSHKATFTIRPFLYTGHVADCKDYRDSQLTLALRDLFNSQWEGGLLQIDNSVVAIFRDRELYYVFDPFRRGLAGQVLDPDDYRSRGVALLQMHSTFDSFSRIMYEKALQMRRGGKFFLHGIKVGCIKPLLAAAHLKNRYLRLKMGYPAYEGFAKPVPLPTEGEGGEEAESEPAPQPPTPKSEQPAKNAKNAKKEKKDKKDKEDKKDKLERTASIKSLPEEEQIPEYTASDVVHSLLEEVLCEIISELPEPQPKRSKLYKQAERVLLQTDKDYLKLLQYKLKHNLDEDNLHTTRQTYPDAIPRAMTLEEELMLPSNYELLPDGTWVIFGSTDLPILEDETTKLGGLLSSVVTAALSAKYKVSTWNCDLIEYALEAVNSFGKEFDHYEPTLATLLNQKLPRISIGQNTYEIEIKKIVHAAQATSLRQLLLQTLICFNRIMVICQRFSCVIIKRYNFLYMFIGFACNPVGYRKYGCGPACMLRFIELDALIRRIEFGCDPHGCEITNYVVVALKVNDVTREPPSRFMAMLPPDERELLASERDKVEYSRRRRQKKAQFLDDELRRENKRIEEFLAQKQRRADERKKAREERASRRSRGRKMLELEGEGEYEGEMAEVETEEEEEEEASEDVELKHLRGKHLDREVEDEFLPRPVLYGYHMRSEDFLYKIQGTVSLPDRCTASVQEIKPCFFSSAVAVLYAALRPLNQWPASRIDRVVNTGCTIASRVSNMTTAYERIIKNITADEYSFDIWVKTFEPPGALTSSLPRKLDQTFTTRRYVLLQTSNATYALFADRYYHLFDSYNTMEKCNEGEEEEDEEEQEKIRKRRHGIKKYCERKTASWVLFPDLKSLLKYIDQRAANPDWRELEEYKLHIVDIISFKKAQPKERILQLLTDMEVSPICGREADEQDICTRAETLAWLDMDSCLPVWSRLNRHNTAGRPRGIALTKAKKYDIEIDKRLWSLWGCLSPYAPCFAAESRGKQFLACNVCACIAAKMYRLANWSSQLLDNIIISGDRYHRESLANIRKRDYEFSLEDLGTECQLGDIRFSVHLEYVAFGKLYATPTRQRMNLADALMYFFEYFRFGVLQCNKRSLAVGRCEGHDGGFFMFDCQSCDHPIFPKGQGAAYLLRTNNLQVLLYCIVVTLNVPYYNVPFTIHKVEMLREGALIEEEEGPSEGD